MKARDIDGALSELNLCLCGSHRATVYLSLGSVNENQDSPESFVESCPA